MLQCNIELTKFPIDYHYVQDPQQHLAQWLPQNFELQIDPFYAAFWYIKRYEVEKILQRNIVRCKQKNRKRLRNSYI